MDLVRDVSYKITTVHLVVKFSVNVNHSHLILNTLSLVLLSRFRNNPSAIRRRRTAGISRC